ncbi:serine/threonine-protein kinase [Glycomyces tarimensis]
MQLGTLIAGRYRLDDRLAAGGMGEVWRGTDTRLNRAVAVKLLHAGLSGNDRFRARFHQEAQAVAALQSPGIVALYDYGEEHSPEGLVSYLIMELVQGQSLAALIHQRGRLSPAETMKIIATAAEALEVAHRAHIIHRDVKPANLLVNEEGTVKIVDFGIASAKGQAGLTETGTVMGTLSYASPEQLGGGDLTGATDLYSLGIVAYECLSGRTPFPGNDPAAVITAHMTGQPAPLPPDVPAPVSQIVMRCLAKDPRQRYGSAGELAQACRTGRPGTGTTAILASPPPGTSPMTRPMTQGMAPGIAAAHTTVQPRTGAMDHGTTPRGGDLPPPRDFEEPERSKAVPVLVTLAGVLVIVVAVMLWRPWTGGDAPEAGEGDPSDGAASAVESAAAEETTEAEESEQDDSDAEEEDSDQEPQQNTEETTTAAAETETKLLALPDTTGEPIADAVALLGDEGFTNVRHEPQTPDDSVTEYCLVTGQSPPAGPEYTPDTPIVLSYMDDPENGCGV